MLYSYYTCWSEWLVSYYNSLTFPFYPPWVSGDIIKSSPRHVVPFWSLSFAVCFISVSKMHMSTQRNYPFKHLLVNTDPYKLNWTVTLTNSVSSSFTEIKWWSYELNVNKREGRLITFDEIWWLVCLEYKSHWN